MNKKITIKINLNQGVKFILSSVGLDIYRAKTEELNLNCNHKFPLFPKRDDKGFVSEQLWSVIHTYSEQIGLGKISPFVDNCIYIEMDLKEILEQICESEEQ